MLGIQNFEVFLAASILLNLTPGPDTLYILGRGIAQGRPAAIASALGISAGSFVHTLFAAFGLSAILAASSVAFTAVKLVGAAYLVYLGVRMLRTPASLANLPTAFHSSTFLVVFRQGMITNLLNPKVALLFLAFMPQFISEQSPSKLLSFLALGLTFVTTGTIWCLCLAWFSAVIGAGLRSHTPFATCLTASLGRSSLGSVSVSP